MSEYDFIEYVKRKRLSLSMNQKTLAKKIPICVSSYCKIETHQHNINYFILRRLAELLNIDLNIIKQVHLEQPVIYD